MIKNIITLICLIFCLNIWSQNTQPIKTKWTTFNYNDTNTIIIPTYGSYNYVVKQNGTIVNSNQVVASVVTVTKTSLILPLGTYEIEITPTSNGFKFYFNDNIEPSNPNLLTKIRNSLVELSDWGNHSWNSSLAYMFQGCTKLVITATNAPDLTGVESLSGMFQDATLVNADFSNWNVSSVKNMSRMFYRAANFNGNISTWAVSNVTNMSGMFVEAVNFNQDLTGWNVSKVVDMSNMFLGARAFNGDISTWKTNNVENMSSMFYAASSFNRDINYNYTFDSWNVSKVKNMNSMFRLATAFNKDLGGWNVSNVEDMQDMFRSATSFNKSINAWNVSKVKNMANMFRAATSFNQALNFWKTDSVTNMSFMFSGATSFNKFIATDSFSLSWNVSNVTNMESMFEGATSFNQPLNTWNTVKLTNAKSMFKNASQFNQDISNLNFESVTDALSFVDKAGLDCTNYSKLLNSLAFLQSVKNNVEFSAQDLTYGEQGFLARKQLINAKGWIIPEIDYLDGTCDDSFLSVDDTKPNLNKLVFYPNPVADNLFIESSKSVKQVNIFTLEGKLLSTSTGTNTINMSSLSKGIYIVKVTFSDGVIHHEKIVKK
jgi:surface protein